MNIKVGVAGGLRNLLEPYRGFPGGVYVLFFANVVNSLGNFVFPLLAILLTDKLGMSKAGAGFFIMISLVAYVPGSLLGGKLADHLGRKKVLVISRLLAAITLLPCAFLGASPAVAWLLIANTVFNGAADPAITSTVTDLTSSKNRQSAFSLLYLGHNIGVAVGPMVAGLLYRHYFAWIFLGDALTTFLSLLLIGLYIGETLPDRAIIEAESDELSANERAEDGGLVRALLKRPQLLLFSMVSVVYSFVYGQSMFGLPLQMQQLFGLEGPRLYGVLMSVNALTVVTFTTLAIRLTSRFAAARNIAVGGFFYAIGFGMIYLIGDLPMFAASAFIWTLGEIMVSTNSQAYVANNTPISHRGRFNAVLPVISGAGFAIGPWIMGRLVDQWGVRIIWPLCFFLMLGASMLMLGLRGQERNAASDRVSG
ncbi:MAG: MFS transporter [Firmicutes bacterium]|nr:MFS transporter [Bacillota bacterium]